MAALEIDLDDEGEYENEVDRDGRRPRYRVLRAAQPLHSRETKGARRWAAPLV
jgi:hypothetical protein